MLMRIPMFRWGCDYPDCSAYEINTTGLLPAAWHVVTEEESDCPAVVCYDCWLLHYSGKIVRIDERRTPQPS